MLNGTRGGCGAILWQGVVAASCMKSILVIACSLIESLCLLLSIIGLIYLPTYLPICLRDLTAFSKYQSLSLPTSICYASTVAGCLSIRLHHIPASDLTPQTLLLLLSSFSISHSTSLTTIPHHNNGRHRASDETGSPQIAI